MILSSWLWNIIFGCSESSNLNSWFIIWTNDGHLFPIEITLYLLISQIFINVGEVVLRVLSFQANYVILCLKSQHSLIPNSYVIKFRFCGLVFARDVSEYQIGIPVKEWSKICLKVKLKTHCILIDEVILNEYIIIYYC